MGFNIVGELNIMVDKRILRHRALLESVGILMNKPKSDGRREPQSKEHRRKISESMKGLKRSKETRERMRIAQTGRIKSEETKVKISRSNMGRVLSVEFRKNMSGEGNQNWRGGTSFGKYCHLFNKERKEEIRNRDNRCCQLCGKSELMEGRRLSVHHINGDKMQGCDGKQWELVTLCNSCNTKKDTLEKEFLIVSNLNIGG